MNLAEFAIRQRIFVIFFTVLCIVAGIFSYFELGKLEDPSFTVKSAVIVTLYPGASAQEVQDKVTDKVETKLQEMARLWKLRSLSKPGMSMVFVDLKESVNSEELPQQWDLLRRKVADVKLILPAAAQISIVQDEFSEVYGMLFSVYGEGVDLDQLRIYAKSLQRQLKAVDGIKKIELHGVRTKTIFVDIPDERLAQYGLSTMQVYNQLLAQSSVLDAGSFQAGAERIRIDHNSQFQSVSDIENFLLKGGLAELGTGLIRLGDIANIYQGFEDPALMLNRYNGMDAVTLAVSPISGINVVALGDTINDIIAQQQAQLPLGVNIATVSFQPEEVDKSIEKFVINVLESVLIVVAILWIFMGVKSAVIVGVSLLISILLTLDYMYIAGIDLQRISLGSFILALGMLVDNAIVITDMIQVKINKGMAKSKAAITAVHETGVPLLGATIIAIMGASPVLFSQTDSAEFASSLFQILSSSLMFSWLVAMTLTPLMCWLVLKPQAQKSADKSSWYKTAVGWSVDNPKRTMLALVPLLVVTVIAIPKISLNFMPASDRPLVFLDYWLPAGADIAQTSNDMKKVEAWLLQQPQVNNVTTFVGASAPRFSVTVEPEPLDASYGQIVINVKNYDDIATLVTRGDGWLAKNFPNAEPRFRALKLATKDKFSIEARFIGPDIKVLQQLSEQAKTVLAQHPNTKYIRDDWRQPSKVLHPLINQDKARRAGVNRADIALTMKRASTGVYFGQMSQGDQLVPLLLRSDQRNLASLETLPVKSLLGTHTVPLGQVVDGFELRHEYTMLWRRNRVNALTVQAEVFGKTASDVRNELAPAIEAIALPDGYRFEWGGEYYDEHRSVTDTLSQMPKAALLMVIILVALFNGFKQPFIIFMTIPLAASGVTFSLLMFDKPFGFMALIGTITLSGMIIKNGIVLMDQIELERSNGLSLSDAIKEATLNRTMAISMGALTTALGMIPLLSDTLFDQMAATIIGGLSAATILTLFIMPVMYALLNRDEPNNQTEQLTSAQEN